MSKGSPPPAPDYEAAAEATAAGNLEATRAATEANRYDQFTPLGSLEWTNLGTEQFDEAGYNAAMDAYNAEFAAYKDPNQIIGVGAYPVMPTKDDYTSMTDQDKWRSDITLSPEIQSLFDKGLMMQDISADIGLTAGDQLKDIFSTPFSLDPFSMDQWDKGDLALNQWDKGDFKLEEFSLGDFEGYREDVYDAMLDRLETDINKDWEQQQAKLYAGGIGRDTEAYARDRQLSGRDLNDARLQSYIQATDQALKERQQGVSEWEKRNLASLAQRGQNFGEWQGQNQALLDQRRNNFNEFYNLNNQSLADRQQAVKEALLQRQTPINEYNAWRTGSQVQLPSFTPGGMQQTVAGPDYQGAAQQQAQYDLAGYNADVMGGNALTSGLFNLGAGYLMGAPDTSWLWG